MKKLLVNEIFVSVSGECGFFRQGEWVLFIRLSGCNLRCSWCDTLRAQSGKSGGLMSIKQVVEAALLSGLDKVIVTGGEPLTQNLTIALLRELVHKGFAVQVETNGSFLPPTMPGVAWIVDYKLPSSQMEQHMISREKFRQLPAGSWVKFVIADAPDYNRALFVRQRMDDLPYQFAFSAAAPMTHSELYELMKRGTVKNTLLNVQIHRVCNFVEKSAH